MDADDLDRTVLEDSPGRQIASPPAQLPDNLISSRIPCKLWRHLIFGPMVRRLREDSPGQQIASPPVQLPDDLICLGILPRLPVRSLLRCAVVCKAWRNLILGDQAFARSQAACPSPASAALARFHKGRLHILTPGAVAEAVAPPNASLSFLPYASGGLWFCSATSGLLCLIANNIHGGATFFVVNPATHAFRAVPCTGGGSLTACLAYDPSMVHRKGYNIIVPVKQNMELWKFWSFSSAALNGGGGWRVSGAEVRLKPYDVFRSKPLYLDGRAHWLTDRGGVAWHDGWADNAGAIPPPPPFLPLPGRGEGRCLHEGNRELVTWHGRIGMVSVGVSSRLAVWALSSSTSSPAQWEMVHWRQWDEIPGVDRPASSFIWSVMPAGLEGYGEEALGLAVRVGHRKQSRRQQYGCFGAVVEEEEDVWRRELLRYDMRTGGTAVVAALVGKEVHDDFGAVFGYHSSMAPLD